jgi:hypothetical protein
LTLCDDLAAVKSERNPYNYALSEEQIKALYEGKKPSRKKESED